MIKIIQPIQSIQFIIKNPNLIAIFLGILHVFCFAPFELYWLQPLILMAFYTLLRTNVQQKMIVPTLLFFTSFFSFGLNWLSFSISMVSDLPMIVVWLMIGLLAIFLAGFYTLIPISWKLMNRLNNKYKNNNANLIAYLFVAVFVAEYLRSIVLTGFPWLSIGYAQSVNPLFHGIFKLGNEFGVYFVGALVVLFSVISVELIFSLQLYLKNKKDENHENNKSINKTILLNLGTLLCLVLLIVYPRTALLNQKLQLLQLLQLSEKSPIIVVQGNIAQSLKFDPNALLSGIETNLNLAEKALKTVNQSKSFKPLIIFPETAIPIFWEQLPKNLQNRWLKLSEKADVLTGIVTQGTYQPNQTQEKQMISVPQWQVHQDMPMATEENLIYANSVVHLGHQDFLYHKKHLVPFGETLPSWLEGVLQWINFPLPHFFHPTQSPLFHWNNHKIGVNICYENLFSDEWKKFENPDFFINVHNLGWFGNQNNSWRSFAQAQYSQITQVRSIEFQKPVIQVGNVGQTMLFLPNGTKKLLVPDNKEGFAVLSSF